MTRPTVDLTGQKFGRLKVIRLDGMIRRNAASLCECDCGTVKRVMNQNLKSGRTVSCGCFRAENASARVKKNPPRLKHGGKKSITYASWNGMFARCNRPSSASYKDYGAKGVMVCDRWSDPDRGYLNFLEDMGERPSRAHTIDRINGGNYEPGNCRWATRVQQNRNVGLKKSNTHGYKGINDRGEEYALRWSVEIRAGEKRKHHLGCYATKEEAALAYNIASERIHGEYGQRNQLPPMDGKTVKEVTRKVQDILKKKEVPTQCPLHS